METIKEVKHTPESLLKARRLPISAHESIEDRYSIIDAMKEWSSIENSETIELYNRQCVRANDLQEENNRLKERVQELGKEIEHLKVWERHSNEQASVIIDLQSKIRLLEMQSVDLNCSAFNNGLDAEKAQSRIQELEKFISSDSVYQLLRLGYKSPSHIDAEDSYNVDLYILSQELRKKSTN